MAEVMRAGSFSCLDVTKAFEADLCEYFGSAHALTYPNGTAAILTALYAAGVRRGDEVVCPAITFWASCAQAQANLGASVVFADVSPSSLTLDADDLERRITPRTKAVVVVQRGRTKALHIRAHLVVTERERRLRERHRGEVLREVIA